MIERRCPNARHASALPKRGRSISLKRVSLTGLCDGMHALCAVSSRMTCHRNDRTGVSHLSDGGLWSSNFGVHWCRRICLRSKFKPSSGIQRSYLRLPRSNYFGSVLSWRGGRLHVDVQCHVTDYPTGRNGNEIDYGCPQSWDRSDDGTPQEQT